MANILPNPSGSVHTLSDLKPFRRASPSTCSIRAAKMPVPHACSSTLASQICICAVWLFGGRAVSDSLRGWANMNPPPCPSVGVVGACMSLFCDDGVRSFPTERTAKPWTRTEPGRDERRVHSSREEWCVGDEDAVLKIRFESSSAG